MMSKPCVITTAIAILFTFAAFGQKVKYKDVFKLIAEKKYQEAEPLLSSYLKYNQDNPNAYLYMGVILEKKSQEYEKLNQRVEAKATIESAVQYLDKAYGMIDEREITRNSDYYDQFKRRSIRSGKYEIKLSDVQYEINRRREELQLRLSTL